MDLDEQLARAWREETHDPMPLAALRTRVHAQRRHRVLQRILEVGLTLLALVVFGNAIARQDVSPAVWLLLPFYAVFLPLAWARILRGRRMAGSEVAETMAVFARVRLAQLRSSLRELRFAWHVASALLGYAVLVAAGAWWLGGEHWHLPAATLLGIACVWMVGTRVFVMRARRNALREYRAMRRLVG